MTKKRIDQRIRDFYPELSRSKIQTLIQNGKVFIQVNGQMKPIKKPGEMTDPELSKDFIHIEYDDELYYVSRGALKIKRAMEEFSISPNGKVCMDVGLSTGGFSDYLLKQGAEKILGIDVGKEQLHPSMREQAGLRWHDKINARYPLDPAILNDFFGERPKAFDLIVVDVSFISLSLIVPNLVSLLAPNCPLVCLVKPQFELSRSDLNSKGVVKDEKRAKQALQKIVEVLQEYKLKQIVECESPIEGDDGNKEFLIAGWSGS